MNRPYTLPTDERDQRRRSFWLAGIFVALLLLVVAVVLVLLYRQAQKTKDLPPAATNALKTAMAPWGGRYCYAGTPRTTAAFPDQITVLTNMGYMVG